MLSSKPPFRPAGRCSGFLTHTSSNRSSDLQNTCKDFVIGEGKRSKSALPKTNRKRRWSLNQSLDQALSSLKPYFYEHHRVRVTPVLDALCSLYLQLLALLSPDFTQILHSAPGYSSLLTLCSAKPGRLISLSKTLHRQIATGELTSTLLPSLLQKAKDTLQGEIEDVELEAALASYLRVIVTASEGIIVRKDKKPALRTEKKTLFSSPKREKTEKIVKEKLDSRHESRFLHFLKEGLRAGDFAVPEDSEALERLFRAFHFSCQYTDDPVPVPQLHALQDVFPLHTVRQWAELYSSPHTPPADTWLIRSLTRDLAKLIP